MAVQPASGKEYDSVTANITSTFKAPAEATVAVSESASKPQVSDEAKAMEARLSTSKSHQSYVFHPGIYAAIYNRCGDMEKR